MSAVDLEAEMSAATRRVRKQHVDRMVAHGVSVAAMQQLFPQQYVFGLDRVRTTPDGLYEPEDGGGWAAVVPVVQWPEINPYGLPALLMGEIVDLVAFHLDSPMRWWWRVGHAWLLGEDLLDDRGESVAVVATPLDWLACGGDAVCILDWRAPASCWSVLRHGPALSFTDDTLRQRVRKALVANTPLPIMEYSHAC